jgi:hypothetical protein
MKRILMVSALAATVLPALALEASAASFDQLKRSYTLSCAVNKTDGVSLKSGMLIITNTSPHTIPKGTRIDIVVTVRNTWRLRPVAHSQIAFRNVNARDTIAFSQPRGVVVGCTAKVSMQPHIKSKVETKIPKVGTR